MASTALTRRDQSAVMEAEQDPQFWEVMQQVVTMGDLKNLSPEHKTKYYRYLCEQVGLPPETLPFSYIVGQGGAVKLYANRNATDLLRKNHHVDVMIIGRERIEDDKGNPMYAVTVRASTPDGRTDESIGMVPLTGLVGEAFCNALMKCETKAKRRVTLSIVGLSIMDELEAESLAGARMYSPREVEREDFRLPAEVSEPPRKPAPAPVNANHHQLAELDRLHESSFPLDARLAAMGATGVEDLTAEEARDLIVEGRAYVRTPAIARPATPPPPTVEPVKPDLPFVLSPQQISLFWTAGATTGWPKEEKRKVLAQLYPRQAGKDGEVSIKSLSREQFDAAIALFNEESELAFDKDGAAYLRPAGPPAQTEQTGMDI